jgi:hypothetical protein
MSLRIENWSDVACLGLGRPYLLPPASHHCRCGSAPAVSPAVLLQFKQYLQNAIKKKWVTSKPHKSVAATKAQQALSPDAAATEAAPAETKQPSKKGKGASQESYVFFATVGVSCSLQVCTHSSPASLNALLPVAILSWLLRLMLRLMRALDPCAVRALPWALRS